MPAPVKRSVFEGMEEGEEEEGEGEEVVEVEREGVKKLTSADMAPDCVVALLGRIVGAGRGAVYGMRISPIAASGGSRALEIVCCRTFWAGSIDVCCSRGVGVLYYL